MKDVYPRYGRSAVMVGLFAAILVVGFPLAAKLQSDENQNGPLRTASPDDPKGARALIEVVGAAIFFVGCVGASRIRLETTDEGIRKYGPFGWLTSSIDWAEITAFQRTGKVSITVDNYGGTRVFNAYALVSGSARIEFNETYPRLSHLIHTIREHLPPTAVNELPAPKPDGSV